MTIRRLLARHMPRLLCAVALAACSILPEPTPVDIWLLPAANLPAAATPPRPWSLRLNSPASAGHLAGQRIAVVPVPGQISVYKGVNWHQPLPALVRDRLFDAFRDDGRIAALSTDEQRVFADFELVSDLRAFQSEYHARTENPPEIVIRLDARLLDAGSRRIVASRRFETRTSAHDGTMPEVIRAFGAAADALAGDLVAWTVDEGDRAQQ
jgi:cholesterol transport system auxiliary component